MYKKPNMYERQQYKDNSDSQKRKSPTEDAGLFVRLDGF